MHLSGFTDHLGAGFNGQVLKEDEQAPVKSAVEDEEQCSPLASLPSDAAGNRTAVDCSRNKSVSVFLRHTVHTSTPYIQAEACSSRRDIAWRTCIPIVMYLNRNHMPISYMRTRQSIYADHAHSCSYSRDGNRTEPNRTDNREEPNTGRECPFLFLIMTVWTFGEKLSRETQCVLWNVYLIRHRILQTLQSDNYMTSE